MIFYLVLFIIARELYFYDLGLLVSFYKAITILIFGSKIIFVIKQLGFFILIKTRICTHFRDSWYFDEW